MPFPLLKASTSTSTSSLAAASSAADATSGDCSSSSLSSSMYIADTLSLVRDAARQRYWLDVLERSVARTTALCLDSFGLEAQQRADSFARLYRAFLQQQRRLVDRHHFRENRAAAGNGDELPDKSKKSPSDVENEDDSSSEKGIPEEASETSKVNGSGVNKDVEFSEVEAETIWKQALASGEALVGSSGSDACPFSLAYLFNFRETALRCSGFRDAYESIKQRENEAALRVYANRIAQLDAMAERHRLESLVHGMQAGNMYDYGALQLVDQLLNNEISFDSAFTQIKRPEKYNHVNQFALALERKQAYRKALIFVDNSGPDVILGMLPFARYLLQQGTEVVLAANSLPAINDVVCDELVNIILRASEVDPIVAAAFQAVPPRLHVVGTGHGGPCLDLSVVSDELVSACSGVDLVVIEGMGRALHTNYHARFNVDCIKLAVVKNEIVATSLADDLSLFDALFLFEPSSIN